MLMNLKANLLSKVILSWMSMRAAVFGRQISFLSQLLVIGQAYEITKPIYRNVLVDYSMYPKEKQLVLSGSTVIKLIKPSMDYPIFTPTYVPLSQIDTMLHLSTFDIVVSIVRVDQIHQVTSKNSGNSIDLAYLFLTDDRKLTLSTTFGTQIDVVAADDRSLALKFWDMITNRKLSIASVQPRKLQAQTCILTQALDMDPLTTKPGTNIRVLTSIVSFGDNSPHTRISCSKCFTPVYGQSTVNYVCPSCIESTVCTAKLFIDFTVEEDGKKTELVVMTRTAEKLLKIKAIDFHNMSTKEKNSFSSDALAALRLRKLPLILTPNATHLLNGDMEWELKYIEGN